MNSLIVGIQDLFSPISYPKSQIIRETVHWTETVKRERVRGSDPTSSSSSHHHHRSYHLEEEEEEANEGIYIISVPTPVLDPCFWGRIEITPFYLVSFWKHLGQILSSFPHSLNKQIFLSRSSCSVASSPLVSAFSHNGYYGDTHFEITKRVVFHA